MRLTQSTKKKEDFAQMGVHTLIDTRAFIIALMALLTPANGLAAEPATRDAARDSAEPALLRVGPARQLARPSDAARVARNGDIVEIDAGVYDGDVAVWRQHNLTIRGTGGRAHLRAGGASAEGKAIWVLKGSNTTIERLEFSGAAVADRNGAGIRLEGAGLTLRDCYFHHNENGILGNADPASDILIEHSEFAYNGFGDGFSHNIYAGGRSLTVRFSYLHHAYVGHNLKSRALQNHIIYNRIMDEIDGSSSYAIDLPNGGLAYVIGNVIQQGPATENPTVVAFGSEGYKHAVNELYFVNNTVMNDLPAGGRFVFVKAGAGTVRLVNNVFAGPGEVLSGPGEMSNNLVVGKSDFVDPANFDFRLKDGTLVVGRGIAPGRAGSLDLRPIAEYSHPLQERPRRGAGALDLGAFEYQPN